LYIIKELKRKELKRKELKRAVLYIIQAFRGVFPQPKK